MFYVIIALFCACVFGLCFLVDRLLSRGKARRSAPNTVRQPRRAFVIGIVMLVAGVACGLFVPGGLGLIGGIVIALLGAVLILSFFSFAIDYGDEDFTCRTLRSSRQYRYEQIRGERAVATRGGIHVMLFVADDSVELSEAMQGARAFLSHAYYAFCRQKGVVPEDCPPPAPEALVWFGEPEQTEKV